MQIYIRMKITQNQTYNQEWKLRNQGCGGVFWCMYTSSNVKLHGSPGPKYMPSHGYVLEYLGWDLKSPSDNSRTEDVLTQNIRKNTLNCTRKTSTGNEPCVCYARRVCASRKKPLPAFFNMLHKNLT